MIKNQRLPFRHTANTAHPIPSAMSVNHSGRGADVQVGFFVGVVTARVVATVLTVGDALVGSGVVTRVAGVTVEEGVPVGAGVATSALKVIVTGPETVTPARSP